jgi:hypothetical protein
MVNHPFKAMFGSCHPPAAGQGGHSICVDPEQASTIHDLGDDIPVSSGYSVIGRHTGLLARAPCIG